MLEKARYIAVEGPIGAGKTSLARRLAQHLQAHFLAERPHDNPFLERFYQDMPRYALATQLNFLFQRSDGLRELVHGPLLEQRVVADYLLDKDPLFAALTLDDHELALYRRVYDALKPLAPTPDLVVYLQAEPETLIERVRRRHNDAERKITETYLARVAERYTRFFHQYDAAPLFIINAESLNPIEEDDDFDLLLQRLYAMRSYREFFGYAE